jgi:hypothetical protein
MDSRQFMILVEEMVSAFDHFTHQDYRNKPEWDRLGEIYRVKRDLVKLAFEQSQEAARDE